MTSIIEELPKQLSGYYAAQPYYFGFGDLWAQCSWAILKQPTIFSTIREKDGTNLIARIRECLNLFDADTSGIFLYERPIPKSLRQSLPFQQQFDTTHHTEPYVPTKTTWQLKEGLCYYGLHTHTKHDPQRFLSSQQKQLLLSKLQKQYPSVIEIPSFWPLSKVIEALSECACYYSIDTGLAHLALSVRTPLYLYDYEGLDTHYPGKTYTPFEVV